MQIEKFYEEDQGTPNDYQENSKKKRQSVVASPNKAMRDSMGSTQGQAFRLNKSDLLGGL